MARRKYPLEIILRHTGVAELIDADDHTLWSSDDDDDFREVVPEEFLTENDIDDILDYLSETEKLSEKEVSKFESGEWDVTEESITPISSHDDDDDNDGDDDVINHDTEDY